MNAYDRITSIGVTSSQYLTFYSEGDEFTYNVFSGRPGKEPLESNASIRCVVFTLRGIADDLEKKYETLR